MGNRYPLLTGMGMMGMGIGGDRGGDGGVIPGHPRTRCHPDPRQGGV